VIQIRGRGESEQSRRLIQRERFTELLGRPGGGGMIGDRNVDDTSACMREDHQDEQQAARSCRHDKEVGRCDLVKVIREERAPGLRWWPVTAYHVLRDRRLRDVETASSTTSSGQARPFSARRPSRTGYPAASDQCQFPPAMTSQCFTATRIPVTLPWQLGCTLAEGRDVEGASASGSDDAREAKP
jgi:hypothetical protein